MARFRMCPALLFCVILVVGCASLPLGESPEIQAVRPRISGIDFQGLDLAFDVDVSNPYPIPLRTPRFRYGMDIQGSRLFESDAASKIDLPARKVGTITLPVRVSYADLLRTHRSLADKAEADYTLHGTLVLPVLGRSLELPLSHSGKIPIVRPPTFSDIKVQVPKVSLMRTKIGVDAAIGNPNAFAIGIKNLGYALKLGDVEVGGLTAETASTLEAGQSGRLSLSGQVSAASAIFGVIKGGAKPTIVPSGSIQTPYGPVHAQTINAASRR